jgi:hypothetical protein
MSEVLQTPKTKTRKIGKKSFEIPANMDLSGMVECWQRDSQDLEKLACFIVANRRLAWAIVNLWLKTYGYLLVPGTEKEKESSLIAVSRNFFGSPIDAGINKP